MLKRLKMPLKWCAVLDKISKRCYVMPMLAETRQRKDETKRVDEIVVGMRLILSVFDCWLAGVGNGQTAPAFLHGQSGFLGIQLLK